MAQLTRIVEVLHSLVPDLPLRSPNLRAPHLQTWSEQANITPRRY